MKHLTIAALLALGYGGAAAAADPAAGEQKSKPCRTCHGKNGLATMPQFPNLAGQNAFYLEQQLLAYRSGKRENEVMAVIAKPLSDDDIADLAAFYQSLGCACAADAQ